MKSSKFPQKVEDNLEDLRKFYKTLDEPKVEKKLGDASPNQPPEIRGWLLLVGLILIMIPGRLLTNLRPLYYSIFTEGTWERLTSSGSEYYIPYWGSMAVIELVAYSILLLLSIYLIYLFFSKHYLFPAFFIGTTIGGGSYLVIDTFVVAFFFTGYLQYLELGIAILFAVIGICYILMSERVKVTFVKHKPA